MFDSTTHHREGKTRYCRHRRADKHRRAVTDGQTGTQAQRTKGQAQRHRDRGDRKRIEENDKLVPATFQKWSSRGNCKLGSSVEVWMDQRAAVVLHDFAFVVLSIVQVEGHQSVKVHCLKDGR